MGRYIPRVRHPTRHIKTLRDKCVFQLTRHNYPDKGSTRNMQLAIDYWAGYLGYCNPFASLFPFKAVTLIGSRDSPLDSHSISLPVNISQNAHTVSSKSLISGRRLNTWSGQIYRALASSTVHFCTRAWFHFWRVVFYLDTIDAPSRSTWEVLRSVTRFQKRIEHHSFQTMSFCSFTFQALVKYCAVVWIFEEAVELIIAKGLIHWKKRE